MLCFIFLKWVIGDDGVTGDVIFVVFGLNEFGNGINGFIIVWFDFVECVYIVIFDWGIMNFLYIWCYDGMLCLY